MENGMRQDAMKTALNAIEAVLPESAVRKAIKSPAFSDRLTLSGRILLVAIGKAAWRMAKASVEVLGSAIERGVVLTKYGHSLGPIPGLEIIEAGHPLPDENTLLGTAKILEMMKGLSPEDTVLFLVSGGGSALFEKPSSGVTLGDLVSATNQLLASGANIVEINMIRKRLSSVKGGRFALAAAPAHVFSVVLSDVLGDRLDSIASGPAHPDDSTVREALAIVDKYGLSLPPTVLEALQQETPRTVPNVSTVIAGSGKGLCEAAMEAIASRGYSPLLMTTTLDCEAREAGGFIAALAREIRASGNPLKPPCALIFGGETVVRLRGSGKGGRNQELALAAAAGIAGLENTIVISVGSDGTDGPTDAAGGIVDGTTQSALATLAMNLETYLNDNDSYNALEACGSLLRTGPTGTNVNDLTILLCR
ncbi:MAG: glycerate kinase [Synergistaceae bacterium]|nr:glycerate kinase [Synergistaceae bacterium]